MIKLQKHLDQCKVLALQQLKKTKAEPEAAELSVEDLKQTDLINEMDEPLYAGGHGATWQGKCKPELKQRIQTILSEALEAQE